MSVSKDCGGNGDKITNNSFYRVSTPVYLRGYFFNDDALAPFNRFHIT
jgi:hypothetical protein